MNRRDQLTQELTTLRAQIEAYDVENLTEEQAEQMDADLARAEQLAGEIERLGSLYDKREGVMQRAETLLAAVGTEGAPSGDGSRSGAGLQVISRDDPIDVLNDRSASPMQLADAVTRSLEGWGVEDLSQTRKVLLHHRRDTTWSRRLLARATEEYGEAWAKYMLGRSLELTEAERASLAVGTSEQGGYLVPTHLDPTIILTSAGSSNVVRRIARVETLTTGNRWNGVTSAGVTLGWKDELDESTDVSPSFGSEGIPLHMADGTVTASIEALEDIANLSQNVLMLFADARDVLEGAAHCTGDGNGKPTGVFTALFASTDPDVKIVSDTAAAIYKADLNEMYYSVPQRFRSRSTWLTNPQWALAIVDLGTQVGATFSLTLQDTPVPAPLGRPMVTSDDAPAVVTTNVNDQRIILGDFANYVLVDKPGSFAIEFIPHLFHTGNNLPAGKRGWYLHYRHGADVVNPNAFRLLVDKTG